MVVIGGKAHYLGRFDSEESWQRYHRLLADPLSAAPAGEETLPDPPAADGPTIDELLVA